MPTKMSLDVLESEKPPMDWEKLDDFPEDSQEDNEEESEEVEEKEEKCKDKCCPSEKTEEEDIDDDTMKIKLGVGPQGVKGRPNQGRPDPKTMKLMLLESIRDKKSRLEDEKDTMEPSLYEKKMNNLLKAEKNAKDMPTDPKIIEQNMEKKAIAKARETAKEQLKHIAAAKTDLMRARAENRVPDNVFHANLERMKVAETRFNKMINSTDEEFMEIIKAENKKAGYPNGPNPGEPMPRGGPGPRPGQPRQPMNPKQAAEMEKKAMADARKTAKDQLEQIGKARENLLKAKAEGRVPDNVFQMNMNRMKMGETQFQKMLDADDDELVEIMKAMQAKAMQMQKMHQMAMAKKQAEAMKAAQAKKNQENKIEEIDEDCEEIDMDQHEKKSGDDSVRMRKNVKSK